MHQSDRDYYYSRAEAELEMAQRATCTPAVVAHVELAERYLALSVPTPHRPSRPDGESRAAARR